ncbi:hypothetical protein [Oscillibacter ruminantium]
MSEPFCIAKACIKKRVKDCQAKLQFIDCEDPKELDGFIKKHEACNPCYTELFLAIDSVLGELVEYICRNYKNYQSSKEYEGLLPLYDILGKTAPEYDFVGQASKLELSCELKKYLHYFFPSEAGRYNAEALVLLFDDRDDAVTNILPYLLTSFYFNAPASRAFICAENSDSSAPSILENLFQINNANAGKQYKAAETVTNMFSMEGYMKKLAKRLGLPFGDNNNDALRTHLSSNYAPVVSDRQVFRAFIYSLFVLACSKVPALSKKVDYKLSFELFDAETLSFQSKISVFKPFAGFSKRELFIPPLIMYINDHKSELFPIKSNSAENLSSLDFSSVAVADSEAILLGINTETNVDINQLYVIFAAKCILLLYPTNFIPFDYNNIEKTLTGEFKPKRYKNAVSKKSTTNQTRSKQ